MGCISMLIGTFPRRPDAEVFDLGFGSGVMAAMMLAAAPSATVLGVDMPDKVAVATRPAGKEGEMRAALDLMAPVRFMHMSQPQNYQRPLYQRRFIQYCFLHFPWRTIGDSQKTIPLNMVCAGPSSWSCRSLTCVPCLY